MQVLKDEIRDNILRVAEDLFYEKGFEEATTRGIAALVGISVSNLYLYYENKEALFSAVVDPFHQYINLRLSKFLERKNPEEDISERICELVMDFVVKDHRKFILLADKSRGTKYEDAKMKAVRILQGHIKSMLSKVIYDKELMSFIFANNLISGIIEIARNYRDEIQCEDSLMSLITYHINGSKALFEK